MTPARTVPVDMTTAGLLDGSGVIGVVADAAFAGAAAKPLTTLLGPTADATLAGITVTNPGVRAERFATTKTDFYDPTLDGLYPHADDPRLPRYRSDAGLTVSYRGKPEKWTGPTEPVMASFKVRAADGTLQDHKIGDIAKMSAEHALTALDTASRAWENGMGEWPQLSLIERCAKLEQALAELVERRNAIIALLEAEIGKNTADAAKEFDRTLEYMHATINEARRLSENESVVTNRPSVKKIDITLNTPRGITLIMGPSNYPWNEGFGTTAFPALLMGNVLMVKPPRKGQLFLQTVLDVFAKHLPEGVLNLIAGDGGEIITPIARSGKINLLYFIGSAKVLNEYILPNFPNKAELKVIAGLGSKNTLIVQPGADPKTAAKLAVQGAFGNRGERCTATSLVYVQRAMADAVAEEVAKLMAERKAGMPWDQGAEDTPLADGRKKINQMAEIVRDAIAKGADVINDGGGLHNGTIFRSAALYPVTSDMDVADKEIFGPVMGIMPYANDDAVIAHLMRLGFNQQVAIMSAKGGEDAALDLAEKLSNQFTEVNIDGIPKRDDSEPGKSFGARYELPLGLLEALLASSIPYTVSTPDTPRWREALPAYAIRRLREKLARVSRKDEAGFGFGSDRT